MQDSNLLVRFSTPDSLQVESSVVSAGFEPASPRLKASYPSARRTGRASRGIRTPATSLRGKRATTTLYQRGPARIRTETRPLKRRLLYRWSYKPVERWGIEPQSRCLQGRCDTVATSTPSPRE